MVWIIVGVLLVLLAMMPIRILIACTTQSVSVKLVIGFLKFSVLPGKAKKKQKNKEKPKESVSDNSRAEVKRQNTDYKGYLRILRIVLDLLGRLRSKAIMRKLDVLLVLAGDDPCDLAILYGRAQGVLAALIAQIENAFTIRHRDVRIECDFTAEATVFDAFTDVSITFGQLLLLATQYGFLILKEYFAILNNKKAVQ